MGSPGCSRQCLALLSLLLLAHTGSAARLTVTAPQKLSAQFDVLGAIQTEVNAMNTNLQELSEAIDGVPEPTVGPTSSPTDEPSPSPSGEPAPSGSPDDTEEHALPRLFIARNFLTLETETRTAGECDKYTDVAKTVDEAQAALDLVSAKQLSNSTLTELKTSNGKLTATTGCVSSGQITLDAPAKQAAKTSISAAEKSGEAASSAIDTIVNPPTPAPEDDSGFRSATIALGVLFSLAVVALIGMGVYAQRQKSGGHMS